MNEMVADAPISSMNHATITRGRLDAPKYSKRESTAFPTVSCESSLNLHQNTEHKGRLYYFRPFFVALSFEGAQTTPVVSRSNFCVLQPHLVPVLLSFVEDGYPEVIKEGAFLSHGLTHNNSYMKNGIDGLHGEVLLHLDDEEVDHFLVRLQ